MNKGEGLIYEQLLKIKNPIDGQVYSGYMFNKGRWSKVREKKDFAIDKQSNKLHVKSKRLIYILVAVEIIQIIGLISLSILK
jgi:hypothetical protein